MKNAVIFSIWLRINCETDIIDAYTYKGKLYYIDSPSDMTELYEISLIEN